SRRGRAFLPLTIRLVISILGRHGRIRTRENVVYTVIRNYTGAPGFANELKKHSKEIESLIRSVPGFIAWYLVGTAEGAASVTVCESKSGCDESTQRAANWIRQTLPDTKVSPPQIIAGDLVFKFADYSKANV